jgi:Rap1a immunity proteins
MGRYVCVAALSLLGLAVCAEYGHCSPVDGNRLYEACTGGDVAFCSGYIAGALDNEDRYFVRADCAPEDAKLSELVDVVSAWLRDHPDKRHLPASVAVADSLKAKFPLPCAPKPHNR